jgi:hypothetical protein
MKGERGQGTDAVSFLPPQGLSLGRVPRPLVESCPVLSIPTQASVTASVSEQSPKVCEW